ncbi:MAG: TfoX/Sxy family protein [Fimbriimonadaceae bacterium]|nr:TfoX/Sxy family protein [Fimbriimonadaceae bacterium]
MRADSFKDFVLDQLGRVPQLMCKAMFGGHGLYQRETFFGIIHKGRLYLKTNGMTQPTYAARGMQPFRPNGKQLLKHYYEVPIDILEDAEQLTVWAHRAIAPPTAQLMLPFHDHPSTRDVLTHGS